MLLTFLSLCRQYVRPGIHWLLLLAFAVDQISETLLQWARRRTYRPIRAMRVNRRGRITHLYVR